MVSCYCCGSVAQLCLTLWDSLDCSPPGSSVHGIFQARILEWVAFSFSKRSSWSGIEPASPAWQAGSLPLSHLGSPDGFLLKSILQEPLFPLSLGENGYTLIVVWKKSLDLKDLPPANQTFLLEWNETCSLHETPQRHGFDPRLWRRSS